MATEEPAPTPPPLRPSEMDAVISARLSVPDRPLRNLMAKMNAVVKGKDDEETSRAVTSFALELESFVLNLAHVEAVAHQTTVQEVQNYHAQVESINAQRQATIDAIAALKRELVDVQQDRQNKLEYDALANEIMKYDTRDELNASLASLRDTIETLHSESSKFIDIMHTSQERFEGVASQLEALRADVGYEVGERERRAVERGGEDGGDVEDETTADARPGHEAAGGEQDGAAAGGEEQKSRARSSLNPAAAAFKPGHTSSSSVVSRGSTPGEGSSRRGSASATGKRTRSSRRTGNELNSLDEEERRGSTLKKVHLEEGEMSDAREDDDDEEEEGAA